MQIKENRIDANNLTLTVTVEKNDWEEPRKKKLNSFRHQADIRGFRKGMAPMSLIERLYGSQAMAEPINTLVGQALTKHIGEWREPDLRVRPGPVSRSQRRCNGRRQHPLLQSQGHRGRQERLQAESAQAVRLTGRRRSSGRG